MEFLINTDLIATHKLSANQFLVYSYIKALADKNDSNQVLVLNRELTSTFDVGVKTIQKAIDRLIEIELLAIEANSGRGIVYRIVGGAE